MTDKTVADRYKTAADSRMNLWFGSVLKGATETFITAGHPADADKVLTSLGAVGRGSRDTEDGPWSYTTTYDYQGKAFTLEVRGFYETLSIYPKRT